MKNLLGCLAIIVVSMSCAKAAATFDGKWQTTLSCADSHGALGYSFRFESVISDGTLHGDKGDKGQPGWLSLDGPVQPDGDATLYVDGIVGAAPFAVGQRPSGTSYGYHVNAHFEATQGSGTRVEGRPCTVTFMKEN